MKKYFTLSWFALVTMLATAAETPPPALTIAVYDFKSGGNSADLGSKVTALVTADLATETNLVMVERAQLTKALSEQAFGISGMVNSDAAAKVGRITGAKVLVAGRVLKGDEGNHLTIVANIIGTETGRLYAAKVEGAPDNLGDLTANLSRKIAETISEEATNLIAPPLESNEQRIERIVKTVTGTNRPTVSVLIHTPRNKSALATPESEFGIILMKAGFTVVDADSDRKPDVEISGVADISPGPRHAGLVSFRAVIELKVQERRTGTILAFDRQESWATDASKAGANRSAQVNAVDALAERIVPLLAK